MRDIYKRASTVIMWLGEPEVQEPPMKLKTKETEASAQPYSPESQTVVLDVKPARTMVTLAKDLPFSEYQQRQVPVLLLKIEPR